MEIEKEEIEYWINCNWCKGLSIISSFEDIRNNYVVQEFVEKKYTYF